MGDLHAVKILGGAQTNFAGGQGFFNTFTFIAPYLEMRPYEEIEQLMQMSSGMRVRGSSCRIGSGMVQRL